MSKETYLFGGHNPSEVTIGIQIAGSDNDDEIEVVYDYNGPKTLENADGVNIYEIAKIHNSLFSALPDGFKRYMTLAELDETLTKHADKVVYMNLML